MKAAGNPPGVHEARVHRSAIGRRALSRAGLPAIALALSQATMTDVWGWGVTLAVLGFAGAAFSWLLLGTNYRIEDDVLRIRMMFRRIDIPMPRITAVRCTSKSSPWHPADYALGTRVVEIDEGGWKTLVSPRDRCAFLAELAEARVACSPS